MAAGGLCRQLTPGVGADDDQSGNYEPSEPPRSADGLKMRLRELAASRVRFGYRRLTVMLRREGWAVNAKRIYRLYTADGLAVRTKVRKKIARRAVYQRQRHAA